MLACARIGAVHSVVFGGFAAPELATRIDDAAPKVIVVGVLRHRGRAGSWSTSRCWTAPSSWPAHKPRTCVILQRPQATAAADAGRDLDWAERGGRRRARGLRAGRRDRPALHPVHLGHHRPAQGRRARQRRARGRAALEHAAHLRHPARARCSGPPPTSGWVVGHSYIVYAPLLAGCTTVLYEGKPVGTPDAGAFWRVVAEHRVKALFTAPTAFRAIKKEDPEGKLAPAGTTCPACGTCSWPGSGSTRRPTGGPANCWASRSSTTGGRPRPAGPIAANPMGLEPMPTKPGSPTVPVPGYDVRVVDADGDRVPARARPARSWSGCRCRRAACPRCGSDDERFVDVVPVGLPRLLPHRRRRVPSTSDGYLFVMGRTDDVINVAGHRLSTGQMEEVLASHPAVAECAVIGVSDAIKGQVPRGFVVLKAGVEHRPGRAVAPSWSSWSATRSGRWRRCARSTWCRPCPRPGRARSCARPCAASPTGRTSRSRRPSRTRRCWTRCAPCSVTGGEPAGAAPGAG